MDGDSRRSSYTDIGWAYRLVQRVGSFYVHYRRKAYAVLLVDIMGILETQAVSVASGKNDREDCVLIDEQGEACGSTVRGDPTRQFNRCNACGVPASVCMCACVFQRETHRDREREETRTPLITDTKDGQSARLGWEVPWKGLQAQAGGGPHQPAPHLTVNHRTVTASAQPRGWA